MEDRQLVEKIVNGDYRSFLALMKRYERLVASLVYRFVDSREDREEVIQDVFVKIHDALPGFNWQSKLSTWISTIAYREALAFLRRKKKLDTVDVEDVEIKIDADLAYEKRDWSEFIKMCVSQLPPVYAAVISLYHLQGYNYNEIVEIMDMPEGTVKNYLFRARKKLKELLTPMLKENENEPQGR
jgi:RNA polymerase sigma-70 factor (ECF subfamily)